MHVIESLFKYTRAKIIEKELGLAELLQKQNGEIFGTQCSCTLCDNISFIHRESKKQDTQLLPVTSRNIDRFSKFSHS